MVRKLGVAVYIQFSPGTGRYELVLRVGQQPYTDVTVVAATPPETDYGYLILLYHQVLNLDLVNLDGVNLDAASLLSILIHSYIPEVY
eukprot:SAG31_NODE_12460_length_940_cov_1.120095_2_plen_88_part_00